VLVGVMFSGLFRVISGVQRITLRDMRMVRG
jgi:hypothetical protein